MRKKLTIVRYFVVPALMAFAIAAPSSVQASVTDSVLYWKDTATTLFSNGTQVLYSNYITGHRFVTAKTQVYNSATATREVECVLTYGGSVDKSRVHLPAKSRSTLFMEVLGFSAYGQNAVLSCKDISGAGGPQAAWSKMNVMEVASGSGVAR